MVMLPHSLNQISVWIAADVSISNCAARKVSASAPTRSLAPPRASPMMRCWPATCRTKPGSIIA